MKCSVCGYEYDDGKLRCPLCGTRAHRPAAVEIDFTSANEAFDIKRDDAQEAQPVWNTYDFPKPKNFKDITMQWPSFNTPSEHDSQDQMMSYKEAEAIAAREAENRRARERAAREAEARRAQERAAREAEARRAQEQAAREAEVRRAQEQAAREAEARRAQAAREAEARRAQEQAAKDSREQASKEERLKDRKPVRRDDSVAKRFTHIPSLDEVLKLRTGSAGLEETVSGFKTDAEEAIYAELDKASEEGRIAAAKAGDDARAEIAKAAAEALAKEASAEAGAAEALAGIAAVGAAAKDASEKAAEALAEAAAERAAAEAFWEAAGKRGQEEKDHAEQQTAAAYGDQKPADKAEQEKEAVSADDKDKTTRYVHGSAGKRIETAGTEQAKKTDSWEHPEPDALDEEELPPDMDWLRSQISSSVYGLDDGYTKAAGQVEAESWMPEPTEADLAAAKAEQERIAAEKARMEELERQAAAEEAEAIRKDAEAKAAEAAESNETQGSDAESGETDHSAEENAEEAAGGFAAAQPADDEAEQAAQTGEKPEDDGFIGFTGFTDKEAERRRPREEFEGFVNHDAEEKPVEAGGKASEAIAQSTESPEKTGETFESFAEAPEKADDSAEIVTEAAEKAEEFAETAGQTADAAENITETAAEFTEKAAETAENIAETAGQVTETAENIAEAAGQTLETAEKSGEILEDAVETAGAAASAAIAAQIAAALQPADDEDEPVPTIDDILAAPEETESEDQTGAVRNPINEYGFNSAPIKEGEEKRPEKFFTFTRKNEEFQQLLNQEYERLRRMDIIAQAQDGADAQDKAGETAGPDKTADMTQEAQELAAAGTVQAQKSAETAQSQEISGTNQPQKPAAEAAGFRPRANETDIAVQQDLERRAMEKQEAGKLEEAYRRGYEAARAKQAELEKQIREEAAAPVFTEVSSAIGSNAFRKQTVETKIAEMRAAEEAEARHRSESRKKLEEMKKARESYFASLEDYSSRAKDNSPAEKTSQDADSAETGDNTQDTAQNDTNKRNTKEFDASEITRKNKVKDDFDYDTPKKHPLLKFFLVLLVLLGLAEGGVIGMRFFMPDSAATETATQIEQSFKDAGMSTYNAIKRYVDKLVGIVKEKTGHEEQVDDIKDGLDFAAVAADANKNIKSIRRNPELCLTEETQTKVEGLADCPVVEDLKVKEAVYRTMIGYNSAWIDYANEGNEEALNFLKADRDAYRSAANYKNKGQMDETFEELQLGEIREHGEGVYIFVKESLSVKDGSGVSAASYNYIYDLEKVGDEYKIVRYDPFK